jgi:hypothetical protein
MDGLSGSITNTIEARQSLRIDPVQSPGKGNGFSYVVERTHPCHQALDPHAETGMWY